MGNAARRAAFAVTALLAAGVSAASPAGGPPVQWVRAYGGPETEEHPHAAARTADGGYVMVGSSIADAQMPCDAIVSGRLAIGALPAPRRSRSCSAVRSPWTAASPELAASRGSTGRISPPPMV